MKMKIAIVLLPAMLVAGAGMPAAPKAFAAPLDAIALGGAVKAASIVHEVPCRMRRYCGVYGCRKVRRCW